MGEEKGVPVNFSKVRTGICGWKEHEKMRRMVFERSQSGKRCANGGPGKKEAG